MLFAGRRGCGFALPRSADPAGVVLLAAHGVIFERLLDLYNRQAPIDISVVAEELKTARQLDQIGGYAFLTQVSSRIPTTAQAGYFIEKVREQSAAARNHPIRQRARWRIATASREESTSSSIKWRRRLFAVTQNRVSECAKQMREPTREAMNVITKMMMKKGELTGISSGFKDLDPDDVGFSAAGNDRPRRAALDGKDLARAEFCGGGGAAEEGCSRSAVLIFSLEMGASQLALRMLCSRARVNMKLLRDGLLSKNGEEQTKLLEAADEFSKAPIFIDDSSAISIMQLRAKARRIHSRTPLGFHHGRLLAIAQSDRPESAA